MKLIMSADLNWNIGKENDLLFKVKKDLRFFRNMTKNQVIIMGRNTYESLGVDALPERKNVVFTSDLDYKKGRNIIVLNTKKELLDFIVEQEAEGLEVFLIGGAKMIREFLPWVNEAIITRFQEIRDADTSMPPLDEIENWVLESATDFIVDEDESGKTVVYRIEYYDHK